MKDDRDVAFGWLRKADSDLANAELCLAAGKTLDTACFHCQ
jgi:HEPN domain-containing protein